MNAFGQIKEFLDKHPEVAIKFEIEPEGIDQDIPEPVIWMYLRDSADVPKVGIRGNVFDNIDENIGCLISAATAAFGFTE